MVDDAVPVNLTVVMPAFSVKVKSLVSPGPCKISLIRMIAFDVEIPEIAVELLADKVNVLSVPLNSLDKLSKM